MLSRSGSIASVNRDVAVFVYEGLGTFEFGISAEIFGLPRPEMGDDWYRFTICALKAGPLPTNSGLVVQVDRGLEAFDTAGTIVIPGWKGADAPVPAELVAGLVRAHARGARLISLCSGAFVLAAAGLLDGRRATTHWRYADILAARYGQIAVDPSVLYVDEGDVLTSAGSAAAVDLLLHVVRKDFGPTAANRVARRLVMPPHRDGGQAQFIERPVPARPEGRLAPLLDAMRRRLDHRHSIAELAAASAMSRRTFLRRFREMTGLTPGRWLVQARIDAAKAMLEEGKLPVSEIAFRAGFGSAETLRHHFRREVGLSPRDYRERFAHHPPAGGAPEVATSAPGCGASSLPSTAMAAVPHPQAGA